MILQDIKFQNKLAGYYKIEAVNAYTGEKRVLADWFPNLITNQGLNDMGTLNVFMGCMVGTSSTTPSVSDTKLGNQIGYTETFNSINETSSTVSPYYSTSSITYRFSPGTATGNISEVGVGRRLWNSTTNKYDYFNFSRALVLDSLGNPTTITVLSNEYLDITYQLRLYPPLDDAYYQVTLDGITYNVTVRAAVVTASQWWAPTLGPVSYWTSSWTSYDGSIGTILGSPSGSSKVSYSVSEINYVNNSMTKRAYLNAGLDDMNHPTGIKSIHFYTHNMGAYQMEFFPAIPKNNTLTFRAEVGVSWARKD